MGDGIIRFPEKIRRPAHLCEVDPLSEEEQAEWNRDLNRKVIRAHIRGMIRIFGSLEQVRREVLAALAETERDGRGL